MAEENGIGYIGLFRELLSKPIWQNSTPEQKVILITLLLMANHQEKEWEWGGSKFKARAGQFVTSLESIKKNAGKGISQQNVRTALVRFEKLEFLTNESTKTGRLITLVNWELYQVKKLRANKATNIELTDDSQRPNKDLTPNNNDKNVKNDENVNKEDVNVDFETVWKLYPKKEGKGQISKTQKEKLAKIGVQELSRAIERYVLAKEGTDRKFIQNGSTFFNSGYVDYLDANYQEKEDQNNGGLSFGGGNSQSKRKPWDLSEADKAFYDKGF